MKMNWGCWILNPENLTLMHSSENYAIDLEQIYASEDILDWVFQILGKSWADEKTVYDLLLAFEDILDPQGNYCSFAEDMISDGGKLAKAYASGEPISQKPAKSNTKTHVLRTFNDLSDSTYSLN